MGRAFQVEGIVQVGHRDRKVNNNLGNDDWNKRARFELRKKRLDWNSRVKSIAEDLDCYQFREFGVCCVGGRKLYLSRREAC